MSKISKKTAEYIAARAVTHAFAARIAETQEAEDVIFDRIVKQVWSSYPGVTVQQRITHGLFRRWAAADVITVKGRLRITASDSAPLPSSYGNGYDNSPDVKVDEPLHDLVVAHVFKREELNKERKLTETQTTYAILAIGTWVRLQAEWPEIWVHAAPYAPQPAAGNLPAVIDLGPLNKALGLPISTTEGEDQ